MPEAQCVFSGERFHISDAELAYCKSNDLPLPQVSPTERLKNLLIFRNRMHLWSTTCAISQKRILSAVSPESGLTVVDSEIWESDAWNPLDYGRDYDFSRSFFEQFAELMRVVPFPSRAVLAGLMENSDYTNGITGAKNCYLIFAASYNEDSYYSRYINYCKNVFDCIHCARCEFCYACRNSIHCYNLAFSDNCQHCSDSAFLVNCRSCSDCYGSVNLSNKRYHFFNQPLSREEYQRRRAEIDLGSHQTLERERARLRDFVRQFPVKDIFGTQNQGSSGDHLNHTKNCESCFFVDNGEDLEHCIWIDNAKSSFFYVAYGNGSELVYNTVSSGDGAYNIKFCNDCWPGAHDLEYCMYTGYNSTHCFGCVGVKRKSYAVLNKLYTKDAYFDLVARIKKQMRERGEYGLFFPPALSPHYYNRSEVITFFPMDAQAAIEAGYRWADDTIAPASPETQRVPDCIDDLADGSLSYPFRCEETGKPFKILKGEADFYRRFRLPPPRIAPMERLRLCSDVLQVQPLREGSCSECGEAIRSVHFSRQRPVLCETCYQESVA